MGFNSNTPRQEFTATAGQTVFTFNFKIFNTSDIVVYLTPSGQTPDDTTDLLTEITDYTVVIYGDNGGTVTLTSGASLNDSITLLRDLPFIRETDYQTGGDLLESVLDNDQDYQTYLSQQLESSKSRFLNIPNSVQGVDATLPSPTGDAYFKWSADGKSIENDTTIPANVLATEDSNLEAASWANENEDVAVKEYISGVPSDRVPTVYSAKHWALKAEQYIIGSVSFNDTAFNIFNNADNTKKINFDASAITTATTRTISMPDSNVDLGNIVDKTTAQTIGGVKTFTSFPITPNSAPTTDYQVANKKYVDDIAASNIYGVRQTVQTSSVDANGFPNYITIGTGLAVDIAATTIPVTIHSANGAVGNDRIGTILADTSVSGLTDATTNYLYADVASDGAVTLGATTLAPVYQFGGTYSVTSGQATFNISEMTMKVGDGATANQTYRVFIGEAVTSGGVVTSVVNYALNGLYISDVFSCPAINTTTNKNHNIGTNVGIKLNSFLINKTSEFGYAIGDITDFTTYYNSGAYVTYVCPNSTSGNNSHVLTVSNDISVLRKDTRVRANITVANWNAQVIAKREW